MLKFMRLWSVWLNFRVRGLKTGDIGMKMLLVLSHPTMIKSSEFGVN